MARNYCNCGHEQDVHAKAAPQPCGHFDCDCGAFVLTTPAPARRITNTDCMCGHNVPSHSDDGTACKRCGCTRYEPRGVDVSEPRDLHSWQVGELSPSGRQYWDCTRCLLSITTDVGAAPPRDGCAVRPAPAPALDLEQRKVAALERIAHLLGEMVMDDAGALCVWVANTVSVEKAT